QLELSLKVSYGYDAFGNRQTTTDPSGATTTANHDCTYHTFVTQTVSPPNAAGQNLVVTFDYYPAFGVQKSRTNPQSSADRAAGQIVALQLIDGLGRVVETQGPDPSSPGNLVTLTTHAWVASPQGTYEEARQRLDWAGQSWN